MKLKYGCNAAWYELNISAADDYVSACCYYAGERDGWKEEVVPLDQYWNSPNMQAIRKMNMSPDSELVGGCSGCYFFGWKGESGSYFPDFLKPYDGLSPDQEANWLAAIDDYKNGRTQLKSTPLRFYINFGFGCNLFCTMCHQVPRRKKNRRQVSADILTQWKPYLKSALEVSVIGGEPFVMPEAIKFIQGMCEDPELEHVRLAIYTNGTLLHKHMDVLAKKRKLHVTVSLDTIGEEFEQIRQGADWKQIERNIYEFKELGQKLGYSWNVSSTCQVMKTNVPKLYDYADWSIINDIQPGFYNFINAEGIEATFERENVVSFPYLLKDVPNWEQCFSGTINRLRDSKWAHAANELENIYIQVNQNLIELAAKGSQTEVELQQLQQQLLDTQKQLNDTQAELAQERTRVAAMASSKFWKIRQSWVNLKQSLGMSAEA